MHKLSCVAIMAVVTIGLSGCTSVTRGTATPLTGNCTAEGFEDLPAASMDCGTVYQTEYIASGYTPRLVIVGEMEILYLIKGEMLDDSVVLPPRSNEVPIKPYAHATTIVERFKNADVVQALVSDNCPVESLYDPDTGPICAATGPLLGQQLNAKEAAVMLGQPVVDKLEQMARDSNRFTVYTVGTASS